MAAQRARAIALALFYGLVPSRFYEPEPHYAPEWSYWRHCWANLTVAARWLLGRETEYDRWFEENINV